MPARSSPSCRRVSCSGSAGVCARRRTSGAISWSNGSGPGGWAKCGAREHRLLARDAAIKLVRPEVLGARDEHEARVTLKRFEREAQATAALSSPHTIQVFDFGITQDGTFYYVMELLTGRDLESLVREFGPLPPNRVIYLLRQVCHSLADAHARGLVHRDIKPANIYACRMGLEYDFAKVLDFGLVKMQPGAGRTRDPQTLATIETRRRERPPTWLPKSSSATRTSIAGRTSIPSAVSPTSC